ncbi:unnamed protein product [Cylicocyclus nassatus]|uniref:Uncharacterized protein n=1 Tax=Cylicocyclus nassatus TaxID=53992 RepID=A0AA36DKN9_CYLNA|nr:unnamed protein product [Cylicocyclus nassatus]
MVYKLFLILLLLQVHGATGKGSSCFWDLFGRCFPCLKATECEDENYKKRVDFCQKFCTWEIRKWSKCMKKCIKKHRHFNFNDGATPKPIPGPPRKSHFSYPRK